MDRFRRFPATLLVFLSLAASAAAGEPLSGRELVAALRQGGYNIYFRHAATDWSRDDHVTATGDWTSCDPGRMRQLSAAGRESARAVGRAIRQLAIPVDRVVTSEYCRARETAQHMNLGPVESVRSLMNMRAADFVGGREAVVERARRLLATPPPPGANTVFVAHGNLMQAATGAYAAEAGAVILDPRGGNGLRIVVQLDPGDWERLARRHGDP